MSNKQIIKVNLHDAQMYIDFFKDGLVKALEEGSLSVKDGILTVETDDKIYKAMVIDFKLVYKHTFEEFFLQDMLFKHMDINNMESNGIMHLFYIWTNPVFEEINLESMIEFGNKFRDKINNDENYFQTVRNCSKQDIYELPFPEKRKYIDRFIKYGIFEEKDKVELGYYTDFPIDKIEELIKEEVISKNDLIQLVSQIYLYENYIKGKNKKSKYNSRIIKAMNLLDNINIFNLYLNNELESSEFYRTKIRKSDILSMPKEILIDYIIRKSGNAPQEYKISSKDLINQYGKNLDKIAIDELIAFGYIAKEDLIYIYEINKVLVNTNYDKEEMYDNDKIEAFYTPKILLSLARQSRLNSSFGEKYREMCDFENDKEKFRQKSLALVAGIKEIIEDENKENSQKEIIDEILYFFDIGLCDLETVKENISIEYIQDKFINDEISTEEILELYQKGIIDDEVVSEYFSDEELIELYENGKINIDCLKCIRNTDYIIDSFYSKKISFKDLVNLYLKFNELSIEDLICSIELAKANSDDIFKFIDKDTSFEKIKELFKNMLIDYSSILLLREQGIISDEQFEKIKESISTKDFFEELNSGKKFKVMTLRESSSSQKKKSSNKSSIIDKSQNDFSDEIDLISKILNNDIQEELDNGNVSYIESYNLDDKPTSLNNYRVFCNEDLDGIVILQKSKKGNAVFVMNVLQLMYFLKGKENANGEIEIQDRMKDKAYLKNIEGVEVVEHSKNFGRNLVEASARVSPKIYERLKISDKKYIEDVEEMVNFMRELYLEKSKSIDDN